MAEQGEIQIDIMVNAQEAAQELSQVDKALIQLADEANKAGVDFEALTEDVDAAAKAIAAQLGISFSEAKKSLQNFKQQIDETSDTADNISGLDDLRDSTGELDSSLKGLGGAVGLVSPEMERLLFVTGELSGGIEAASRLTALAGGSMKSLMVAGGALGVAVGALGGAWMFFNRKVKAAEERLAEAHAEMESGIAAAKKYKQQIQGLENDVGLLADEEFNLIEARRKANEFMQEEIDGNRAARTVTAGLTKDLEKLLEARKEIEFAQANQEKGMIAVEGFRDLGEAIAETNKAYEEGTEIRQDFGTSTEVFTTKQVRSGEALAVVNDEIQKARHAIENYGTQISDTERRTNRLNILFRIQAAQAAEDNVAIRNLALGLATLGDAQATMGMLALRAAKNTAILQAQMLSLGPATGAAIAQIERMFDRLIDQRAPSAFAETYEKLKVTVEDTSQSVEDSTEITIEGTDADNTAAEAAQLRAQKLDMLAAAQGRLAVIDRDYAKAKQEIIDLDEKLGLTTEEMTELFKAAMDERQKAIDDFNDEQKEAYERQAAIVADAVALEVSRTQAIEDQYSEQLTALNNFHEEGLITKEEFAAKETEIEKNKSAALNEIRLSDVAKMASTASMMVGMFDQLISGQIKLINTKLDNEKEAALEAAGDDQERIDKINADFEKRRSKELAAAFKKQKGLEIANAIASAASATVAALSAPPTGLGPVFGPLLFPVIGTTLVTQLALIKNQQPTFHTGGIVDGSAGADVPITAQQGEVVLSRDAVASLGGPAQANALNASGGQAQPMVIELTYRQKVFDRVVVDSLAKGGPLKNALNSAANVGRRGRIGGRL